MVGLSAMDLVTPTAAVSLVAVLVPVGPAAPSVSSLISASTFDEAPCEHPLKSTICVIPVGGVQVTQYAVEWYVRRRPFATVVVTLGAVCEVSLAVP